jgi:hypothetical protein
VKPPFQGVPRGMTPERFVELMNDARRHESADVIEHRARLRRERVVAARQEGKSIRAIADAEDVSEKTVRNDLEKAGAEGSAPELPEGKVSGRDGKKYSPPGDAHEGPILCSRCQRIGKETPVGCEKCKQAREADAKKANKKGTRSGAQRNGQPVYDWRGFRTAYGELTREIDKLARMYGAKDRKETEALHADLAEFKEAFTAYERLVSGKPALVPTKK